MSKVPMKRIFICGLKRDRKQILEFLQMESVVEIDESSEKDEYLKKMDVMPKKLLFDKNSNFAEQALSVLESYAPEETTLLSSLEAETELPRSEYEQRIVHAEEYLAMAKEILALEQRIGELRDEIPKIENREVMLRSWERLDVPLSYEGTAYTKAFIGTIPGEHSKKDFMDAFLKKDGEDEPEKSGESSVPPVEIDIISSSKEQSCIFLLCLRRDEDIVEAGLKQLGFAYPKNSTSKSVPATEIRELKAKKEGILSDITKLKRQLIAYTDNRKELKFASDYYAMRAEKYRHLQQLPQSESAFFIEGYVPSAYSEELRRRLTEKFSAYVELSDPEEGEDVPVALSNGLFSDPMETVVESYSLPGPGEIDPSRVVSIFYYVFFGIMLSDAGYGILLSLATGYVLLKVKNMKPGMKKMMKLFFYGGLSTIVWGFMFGSFFGNAVNVIAATFFGRPDISLRPLWFEPMSEPMRFLVFAFSLGIVHILTGLGIKLYQCLKAGDIIGAVCDSVLWFMFVGGGIVYLLTMPMVTGMLGLSFTLGSAAASISAAIAIIGAIGVVLTGGRESKNWFKRLLKGAYSAYGITGYLSDILSYSRLLALGLATGVIAQVFNQMGSMLGATWYGALIFIIIFLIGHVLNIGINVLGAYVHTNRLQFVEFFGKFYDGGGRKFEPFSEHTKYFKIKEDN